MTSQYLDCGKNNKVMNTTPYDIHSSEQRIPRHMHTKLAQLRANKSPLLESYLHTVNPETYMPQCPLCLSHIHLAFASIDPNSCLLNSVLEKFPRSQH